MADNGNKPVPPDRIARLLMIDDSDVKSIVNGFKKVVDEDGNSSNTTKDTGSKNPVDFKVD